MAKKDLEENPDVPEQVEYENFLDEAKVIGDEYTNSLERFLGEKVDVPISSQKSNKKKEEPVYKKLKVHFTDVDAIANFCELIGQVLYSTVNETYYPLSNPSNTLFDDDDDEETTISADEIDRSLIRRRHKKASNLLQGKEWILDHWKEMPEFDHPKVEAYRSVEIKFRNKEDYDDFARKVSHVKNLTEKTVYMWYPYTIVPGRDDSRYEIFDWYGREVQPKYPMYVVSKGRSHYLMTSRYLAKMGVKHYIVVEPQEKQDYMDKVIEHGIDEYTTILVAPFSNHGDGPGRARNWVWDHSMSIGAEAHWVLDDNIQGFLRINKNASVNALTGAVFRSMEDFMDRYENIMVAGPNYESFILAKEAYPAITENTRVYSCLLIRNDCRHRWRGRYNEDTDLSLRILKDGDCVVQFNHIVQKKATTQTMKGGNTQEFYHAEGEDKDDLKEGFHNPTGTINKSKMLVDMHPDVTKLVWKFSRWHHEVDYSPFRNNPFIFKEGVYENLKNETNEYDMMLWDKVNQKAITFDDITLN